MSQTVVGTMPAAAQDERAVARPTGLPALVPFAAGIGREVSAAYEPGSPDGYGLHLAAGQVAVDVLPLFGGRLEFAGCANGDSASLGRSVMVGFEVDDTAYLAVHGHLSVISPDLLEADAEQPLVLASDDVIGRHGEPTPPDDGCPAGGPDPDDLYVGILRDAQVTPDGEVVGGTPVSPEPLVGERAYEGLSWWPGPVVGAERATEVGNPRVRWNETTPASGSRIRFGEPIKLKARVRDDVDIDQVRFRAWYPEWPKAPSSERPASLDPDTMWREIAVCAAPDSPARAYTNFCDWDGDTRDAKVTYTWDPTLARRQLSAPWLPPARAAIGRRTSECVPVSLAVEVVDRAGNVYRDHADLPRPEACDDPAMPLSGGRVLYLDPLMPPRTPVSKDTPDRVWPADRSEDPLKGAIVWRDRSDSEVGFHIHVRRTWEAPDCSVVEDPWQRIDSVLRNKQRYRPDHDQVLESLSRSDPSATGDGLISWEYAVSAWNAVGETELVPVASFIARREASCEPGAEAAAEQEG